MQKKANVNTVLLILICILILLIVMFIVNRNLFYFTVLLGFYIVAVHYVESSKFDNISPAINHFLVIIFFSLLYIPSAKGFFVSVLNPIKPDFTTHFGENLYLAILLVLIINILSIIITSTVTQMKDIQKTVK